MVLVNLLVILAVSSSFLCYIAPVETKHSRSSTSGRSQHGGARFGGSGGDLGSSSRYGPASRTQPHSRIGSGNTKKRESPYRTASRSESMQPSFQNTFHSGEELPDREEQDNDVTRHNPTPKPANNKLIYPKESVSGPRIPASKPSGSGWPPAYSFAGRRRGVADADPYWKPQQFSPTAKSTTERPTSRTWASTLTSKLSDKKDGTTFSSKHGGLWWIPPLPIGILKEQELTTSATWDRHNESQQLGVQPIITKQKSSTKQSTAVTKSASMRQLTLTTKTTSTRLFTSTALPAFPGQSTSITTRQPTLKTLATVSVSQTKQKIGAATILPLQKSSPLTVEPLSPWDLRFNRTTGTTAKYPFLTIPTETSIGLSTPTSTSVESSSRTFDHTPVMHTQKLSDENHRYDVSILVDCVPLVVQEGNTTFYLNITQIPRTLEYSDQSIQGLLNCTFKHLCSSWMFRPLRRLTNYSFPSDSHLTVDPTCSERLKSCSIRTWQLASHIQEECQRMLDMYGELPGNFPHVSVNQNGTSSCNCWLYIIFGMLLYVVLLPLSLIIIVRWMKHCGSDGKALSQKVPLVTMGVIGNFNKPSAKKTNVKKRAVERIELVGY